MITQTLATLITRDLQKLKAELELYEHEINIWKVDKNIANTAGNLCLHLVGNLNTYIGATLGNTGYVRDRDAEFALKNIPRSELIQKIEATINMVQQILPSLDEKKLTEEYPLLVLKEKTSTEYFLVHLAVHLGYHLGQVNYHRRLLD
ncbi:MAG: DinB family protein [Bacteroidetes bacterium CHB5]|nr:DinB family protein [Bacteroidetes bacterium CHB5]